MLLWHLLCLLLYCQQTCDSFTVGKGRKNDHRFHTFHLHLKVPSNKGSDYEIDYQSDGSSYGRGEMHLSAMLEEQDVVVYQTGTWEVEGVEVGNGNPPSFEYCVIDTLQVVWTHNCEHGFISGLRVSIDVVTKKVQMDSPLEFVDFGPEQLIARLPVSWIDENEAELLVDMPKTLQNLES